MAAGNRQTRAAAPQVPQRLRTLSDTTRAISTAAAAQLHVPRAMCGGLVGAQVARAGGVLGAESVEER